MPNTNIMILHISNFSEIIKVIIATKNHSIHVGDIVTVITKGARAKRHQPDGGDSQILQVVEFLGKALKIADAVIGAVEKTFDMQLIYNDVFKPEGIVVHPCNTPGDIVHSHSFTKRVQTQTR